MRPASWLKPPRLVLTLFLGVTGVLSAAMAVLAWQLVEQDKRLAGQRVQERLDAAADAASAAVLQDLGALEERLTGLAALPADRVAADLEAQAATLGGDAVLVVAVKGRVTVYPRGRTVFSPEGMLARDESSAVSPTLAKAEALELQSRDLPAALAAYRALRTSPDPNLRAIGLARAARVAARLGRPDEALRTYGELQGAAGSVEGLPAGLVASYGRCLVLRDERRREDLQREARALSASLSNGRWPLSRSEYAFYVAEARSWLPQPADAAPPPERLRESLSEAADAAWRDALNPASQVVTAGGRRTIWAGGASWLVVWRVAGERTVAVVAGPSFIASQLLSGTQAVLDRQRARAVLSDVDGHVVVGASFAASARRVRRAAADTRLPWTLTLGEADPDAAAAEDTRRRRLVLVGLLVLGAFVVAGSAFILRAVRREAKVARLQTDFVSAVSHEFRTPLASMRQLSELLADGRVASDARRDEYYRTLQRESERLQRLVEALLDFGRMDSGAREYAFAPIDINALAADTATEFGAAVRDRGYTIDAAYGADVGRAAADREALGRALWNLLDNAVKYSPDCRTVWLRTSRQHDDVRISVRDGGVGIAADERAAIFDKFRRGTSAASTRAKGTGLGLSMVRHIVSAHRGRVSVESEPGKGSTFTIELPAGPA